MKHLVLSFLVAAVPFSYGQAKQTTKPSVNTWEILGSLTESFQKDETEFSDLETYSLVGKVTSSLGKGESCTLVIAPKKVPSTKEAFEIFLASSKETKRFSLKENLKNSSSVVGEYTADFEVACADKDSCLNVNAGYFGRGPQDGGSRLTLNLQKKQNVLNVEYSKYVFDDDWGPSTATFSCEFGL